MKQNSENTEIEVNIFIVCMQDKLPYIKQRITITQYTDARKAISLKQSDAEIIRNQSDKGMSEVIPTVGNLSRESFVSRLLFVSVTYEHSKCME